MFPTPNLKRIISVAVVAGILISCNNSATTKKQTEELPAKDITENTMEDKTLIVKELEFAAEKPSAQEIEDALNAKNVEYNQIACVNWDGYNGDYTPDVKFRIGYTEKEIYIQYLVTEDDIKAAYGEDAGSKPYTDSCVEFFAIPGEGGEYYNLELNCIGKGTFAGGAQRTDRTRYGDDELSQIRRESTLGGEAFGTRTKADNGGKPYTWKLTVALPVELYSLSEVKPLKGRSIKANFYKCGDDMPQKHYLSWHPIRIEKPNFHKPDHFGTLIFE